MHPYDLTIPSFRLRGTSKLALADLKIDKILFAEDEVDLRAKFDLSSPRLIATIVCYDGRHDQTKTLEAEYQLTHLAYSFDMVARLDTESVELRSVSVLPAIDPEWTEFKRPHKDIELAADQALFYNEKLYVMNDVQRFLQYSSYIVTNCERAFRHYIEGALPLGKCIFLMLGIVFKKEFDLLYVSSSGFKV